MDLISLRWTLRAAEHSSFRSAAKTLGVEQAAVSRRIRALEDEIGVSIFERRRDGVVLTNAGREFLARVRSGLAEIDSATHSACVAGRAETGALTVSFYQSLASGTLQKLLAQYRAAWPDVRLEFLEMETDEQLSALRDRRVDVAFVFADDEIVGLDSELLWREPIYVAAPDSVAFAVKRRFRWADLHESDILMRGNRSGFAEFVRVSEHLKAAGLEANIRLHRVSREGLLGLVAAGYGVTIISKAACAVAYPGVIFRKIAERNSSIPVRMAWVRANDNPALRRFMSHIRKEVRARRRD
jgi:DNA-binding transcriptional LysR family regulator